MDLLLDFLPWIIGGGSSGVVGMIGYGLYKADAMGWKADARRISRNIRARINSGKAAKALEISTKDIEKSIEEDWDTQFKGEPAGAIKPLTKTGKLQDLGEVKKVAPKHEIVKKDFYRTFSSELWPRVICKCGWSEHIPILSYESLQTVQKQADRNGSNHVINMNKAEEVKAKSSGKFAW